MFFHEHYERIYLAEGYLRNQTNSTANGNLTHKQRLNGLNFLQQKTEYF